MFAIMTADARRGSPAGLSAQPLHKLLEAGVRSLPWKRRSAPSEQITPGSGLQ
jgi:hypothetical protein